MEERRIALGLLEFSRPSQPCASWYIMWLTLVTMVLYALWTYFLESYIISGMLDGWSVRLLLCCTGMYLGRCVGGEIG
jgi:hypothetical protein